ncbi:MAG: TonB-dependent receptor family protein [Flavobacteriales bacterium]
MNATLLKLFICLPFANIFSQTIESTDSLRLIETQSISIIGTQQKFVGGSGQKITPAQLQKINQPDINKVLRTVPGVQVRDEDGYGLRPNIGLRGTPVNRCAKITLMEDGMLIAPASYADPSAYYFPTFTRISAVEVLKGSSQIKYGPYTIGGAINLLSTPIPQQFKGFIQASYGSFGTNQERIWVGDAKGNFSYLFEVNRIASEGFKILDNGGNTGFDRRDFMIKSRWQTDQEKKIQQSVNLKVVHVEEIANETYLGLNYEDFIASPLRRYAGTQKDVLNLSHNHLLLQHYISPIKNLQVTSSAYLTKTFRDWGRANSFGGKSINNILADKQANLSGYDIMTGSADGEVIYRAAARTFLTKGLQSNIQYHFRTGTVKHHAEAGVRLHQDAADRYGTQSKFQMTSGNMILTDGGEKGNQENQTRAAWSLAMYASYQLNYKKLTLQAGLRHEKIGLDFSNYGTTDYSRTGTNLSSATNTIQVWLPGLSLDYALNTDQLLFVGIHKGFSPPGMPSTNSAEQAESEIALNYELGYRLSTAQLYLQAVLFRSAYQNLLGSDNISGGGIGTGDLFNAGKAQAQGVELSVKGFVPFTQKMQVKFPLQLTYTFTQAIFQETFVNGGGDWGSGQITKGDYIPFIAPHLASLSAGAEAKKWNVFFTANYVGKTRVKPGQDAMIFASSNENYSAVTAIQAFSTIDCSINVKLNKNIDLFTSLQNIGNNQSIVANLPQGYRPLMPRSIIIGLKLNLN